MSWDSYIDTIVDYSKDDEGNVHIDKVAIIGLDGSTWTSSAHQKSMTLQDQETRNLSAIMKSKDYTPLYTSGLMLGGVKYQFLRDNEGTILAKKKDQGAVTCQASTQAIVIAHCPEGGQHGNCNKGVNKIVKYLMDTGY